MTVFEFQASRIERIAAAMAHFIATTRDDALDWHPPIEGADTRSIYEQVGECVLTNRSFAAALRGENRDPKPARDASAAIVFADSQDAQRQIVESAAELAKAVRGMNEEDFDREYPHWSGPIRGEIFIEMPYRNMAYHAGQVNYIQTLYGDTEFHVPEFWRK